MKSKANQDPMSSISSFIQQIKETEAAVREENDRIKQLVAIQEALIQKQRNLLIEVAKTSSELLEVETQRTKLKQNLTSQKSKLLISAGESSETNSIVEQTLSDPSSIPSVSNTEAGAAALKAVELIQKSLFAVTEEALKSEDLSVPSDSLQTLVSSVNDIIQRTIKLGHAKETAEDTVRRQSFVISSLVGPSPEEN